MRITFLHQYFNTPKMAGGTRSYEMARRLVAMGHEVNMVTSWREPDDRKGWFNTEEAGIKVHWLPVPYSNHMSYNQRILSFFKFAWGAARKAASVPADVVFATSTPLTIAVPGAYAARRQNVPMVFEVRDLWPEVPIAMGALQNPVLIRLAYFLERFAIKNSVAYIALFDRARASLEEKGVDARAIDVIPNGSDLALFSNGRRDRVRNQLNCHSHTILLVYAGTFGRVNGLDYILDLAERLKNNKKFVFLMIGEGSEKEKIISGARDRDLLGNNIFIKDGVPKSEIVDYLAAADIVLSTVMPLKILEADSANKVFDGLAAGRFIAVNHGGHLTEILEDSGAGICLESDINIAAEQLQKLGDDPDRIEQAKIAARKLAEERFSRDKLAAQFEQVLLRAVRSYSRVDR